MRISLKDRRTVSKAGVISAIAALGVVVSSGAALAAAANPSPIGFGPASSSSWVAGVLAGYNWQRGAFVFGLEGDISGTGLKSETTGSYVVPYNTNYVFPSADATAKVDWYGTIRGRFGGTVGSFLIYGTGGLAFGDVSLTNRYDLGTAGQYQGLGPVTTQSSGTRLGYVGGVGVDYMVLPNLILNFEYRYVDLGTISVDGVAAPAPLQRTITSSASVHAQFQTVTLGVSYKFAPPAGPRDSFASMHVKAPPPPVNPWEGVYVGARAGGAFGNDLSAKPGTIPRN